MSSRRIIVLIGSILVIAAVIAGAMFYFAQQPDEVQRTDENTPAISETTQQPPVDRESQTKPLTVYYIAMGDDGTTGDKIGCGDSVVSDTTEEKTFNNEVEAAFEYLFTVDERTVGESGLYNALYQSNLSFEHSNMSGETSMVYLNGEIKSGGVCDGPRIKAQLEQTAKAASGAKRVIIHIGDKTLDEVLGAKQ